MEESDFPVVLETERRVFSDPWSERFFRDVLGQSRAGAGETFHAWARVAERAGAIAGYSVTTVGSGVATLENIATLPGERRNGVARALLADLFEHAATQGAREVTLEVRASNDAAQALYRLHGFRFAGLRRSYYQEPAEDALVMTAPLEAALAVSRAGTVPGA
jgi:ribosomal-protein-alanine N-acetyltransferase